MYGSEWGSNEGGRYHRGRFSADGIYEYTDPAEMARERFSALGAHVIAYGRMRMARLMEPFEDHEIVYAHTDSLWTTRPHPDLDKLDTSDRLGALDSDIKTNVTFVHGRRLVEGSVDSAPGRPRAKTRRYVWPHTLAPVGGSDWFAAYTVR